MYGEKEVEYGGDMKNANRPNREVIDHDSIIFQGYPEFWKEHGVLEKDESFSKIFRNQK